VSGGKYLRMRERYGQGVRTVDPQGNRQLFYEDVLIAHLLAFFNPTLRSLRTVADFSQTRQAQRPLSVRKRCKSPLADFPRVADPLLREPLVARLRARATVRGTPLGGADWPTTLGQVLAVAGSFFAVAAAVAWAVRPRSNHRHRRASIRLDVPLAVHPWLPAVIAVCGREEREAAHAAHSVQPGAIHSYDRGMFSFALLTAHLAAPAWFVHRVREPGARSPQFSATQACRLTAADHAAGVLTDHLGHLAGSTHRRAPQALLREVGSQVPDHPEETGRRRTHLLEFPAHVLGPRSRYRWQVDLFFRWLKVYAHCAHLLSESRQGVLLSFSVAVSGVLLMDLPTGAKPSQYAFSLLGLVAAGAATLAEVAPILAERERRIARARARVARRRAAHPRAG
jgi:hypothetical protein